MTKLTEKEIEKIMIAKGYKYRLTPTKDEFAPLYVKTLKQAAEVHRDYPNVKFYSKTVA